jgi:hypothetical protein
MSAVVAGVKAKLMLKLPGQIGTNRQWSDTYIETLILAAAHAAAERIGYQWVTQAISLVNNQHEYALQSSFIEVLSVDYSADGTSYIQHLSPVTLTKLDRVSTKWRDDRSFEPNRYVLISTPGLQSESTVVLASKTATVLIYPAVATVGSAKIRVSGWGIGSTTSNVPDGVQDRVLVPYVMAMLRATQNQQEAADWFAKYVVECDKVRGRFNNPYVDGVVDQESN